MSEMGFSLDDQSTVITEILEPLLNKINESQPALAGDGDLHSALSILAVEMAASIVHCQRTFVLVTFIQKLMFDENVKQARKFEKSGENFDAPFAPASEL